MVTTTVTKMAPKGASPGGDAPHQNVETWADTRGMVGKYLALGHEYLAEWVKRCGLSDLMKETVERYRSSYEKTEKYLAQNNLVVAGIIVVLVPLLLIAAVICTVIGIILLPVLIPGSWQSEWSEWSWQS